MQELKYRFGDIVFHVSFGSGRIFRSPSMEKDQKQISVMFDKEVEDSGRRVKTVSIHDLYDTMYHYVAGIRMDIGERVVHSSYGAGTVMKSTVEEIDKGVVLVCFDAGTTMKNERVLQVPKLDVKKVSS